MDPLDTLAAGIKHVDSLLDEDALEPDPDRDDWGRMKVRVRMVHDGIDQDVLGPLDDALGAADEAQVKTLIERRVASLLGSAGAMIAASGDEHGAAKLRAHAMATERLAMHHLKEILRQKLVLRRSHRKVAKAVGVSVGLVSGIMSRATVLQLVAEDVDALDEAELEEKFYGQRAAKRASRPLPDPAEMHVELKRAGVTLQLLHLEYLERHPDGYRYTTYCDAYRAWLAPRVLVDTSNRSSRMDSIERLHSIRSRERARVSSTRTCVGAITIIES